MPYTQVDPASTPSFLIGRDDKVATAGRCFAQHIARHLSKSGFNYFLAEQAHPIFPANIADDFTYGVFSTRYGNISTSRQLVQLFDCAYRNFLPEEDFWAEPDGSYVDPFRPTCNPGGIASVEELRADRAQHFACIRRMFEDLNIFVFTLGLTETWVSRSDGSVYPVCPGTAAGNFDPEKYQILNLGVTEVIADMKEFLARLASVNSNARLILTVSPVPLVATAVDRHVLSSTTLSKSVLRVAADVISREYEHVSYFESYETIMGTYNRGRYFADDLRSVTEEGVSHVMRLFLRHYTEAGADTDEPALVDVPEDNFIATMSAAIAVICHEEVLGSL